MKRNDWILIGTIVAIALLFGAMQFFRDTDTDATLLITVKGKIFGEYPLDQDIAITINETNWLVIQDGSAKMKTATCPDQLCVHQKAISKDGETIVCLPNKVIATVIGGEDNPVDAITN